MLALSGCAQQHAGSLPATPSLLQSTSARTGRPAAALPQKYKVNFPTPTGLDEGFAPSVVMLTPSRVLEEHTNEGKLFYRFGNFVSGGMQWGALVPSGAGTAPNLATNGSATLVELHYDIYKGMVDRVGTIRGSEIDWGSPTTYDQGVAPRAAFAGGNTVVEVHSGGNGQLWYHLGTLDPVKRVIDFGESKKLDSGYFPSVAANSSGTVVELHAGNGLYGYSHQYYHVGQIDVKNNKIDWGASIELPNTVSSVSNITWSPQGYLVATYICSAPYPFNIYYLCTQMGTLNPDNKSISWFGTSKSALIYTDPSTFSTALNGDAAITMLGYETYYKPTLLYATSLLGDRANWEGDRLETALKGKSLHQIVFPASHDAGMYVDTGGGSGAEALAQDQDLYQQLTGGQRYFDLRPDYNLHFFHGPVEGASVQGALNDVAKFMMEGHREVVVLKFSHFCFDSNHYCNNQPAPNGSKGYTKLLAMIQTTLAPWLYFNDTGKRLADVPLATLLKQGHGRVLPLVDVASGPNIPGIYTYRDYEQTASPATGQFTAFDQYTNTLDYTGMKNDQLKKFGTFDGKMLNSPATPCDFFLLSWTLTPVSLVYSVAGKANSELGPVMAGVQRNTHGQIPNILYVDFYEWADPTDVAIAMNARF